MSGIRLPLAVFLKAAVLKARRQVVETYP